ncbi:hypothetical protein DTO212C5_1861 [Paecilomyces variotii]|nr:hypothetical protein DTO212C5_1861 [Paecilomyces variotii]
MTMPKMTRALVAGLALMAPGIVADSSDAQSAMSAFLSANPISTRSASSSSKPTDLTAAVLAGNFTPSRSWDFLHDPCPGSCESLGVNSSYWPAYSSMDELSRCDETMLLQFSLNTPVDNHGGKVILRSCTANLVTDTTTETERSSCTLSANTTSVTSSIQIYRDIDSTKGSSNEAIDALSQLLAYDTLNPVGSCDEAISFAYSGNTAVGLYMGSGLRSQNLLPSVINELIDAVEENGTPGTLMVQLCDNQSARYSMGLMISSVGGLSATQSAVQTWRDSGCAGSVDKTEFGYQLGEGRKKLSEGREVFLKKVLVFFSTLNQLLLNSI